MDNPDYIPRMDFDELQYQQTVSAGIAAVKGGDREQARRLLIKAAEMKPGDPEPWLWLSATTDDPHEQRGYLEYALAADPANSAASRGLALLSDKIDRSRLMVEGESIQPRQNDSPEEAQVNTAFICPQCGSDLTYDPAQAAMVCRHCGYQQPMLTEKAGESSEQVLDFVLPTTRGHRWAEAQHRLSCTQCGAITILPAGEKIFQCPYCASDQMIESAETIELVDPQVIVQPSFEAGEATRYFKQWLGKGLFTPDDLKKLARPTAFQPAYYPFWTFDGACQMRWSCEVNTGASRYPNWVLREGVEYELFDDVLVAGMQVLERERWKEIEPFNIKEAVKFEPGYLAGWRVLVYDISLAEASLTARELIARKLRRDLSKRVQIGVQRRNLRSGSVEWSGMTFKHVLLPLWVGAYRYHGRQYRILINGQSGKIMGQKPIDRVKVISLGIMVLAAFLVLLLGLLLLALHFGWVTL